MRFPRVLFGGTLYCLLEVLWRGYSHISMFFLGGGCFWLMSRIGRMQRPFYQKILLAVTSVTAAEFLSGLLLNRWLKLEVWDYSNQPFNLLGQICPLFILLWIPLCVAGILLNGLIDRQALPSGRLDAVR